MESLKWDAAGLVTVVAQDRATGEVRMVAHADRAAVEQTLRTKVATFFSRSRQALWVKGESSGNTMAVTQVFADCDGDALVYLVEPEGPSCHTGEVSCFFRPLLGGGERAQPVLAHLQSTLVRRRDDGSSEKSYTRSLLSKGAEVIAGKVREEGEELAVALETEGDERVISEAADVLYHVMVGLLARGLTLREVELELARRFGMSGLEEKASR